MLATNYSAMLLRPGLARCRHLSTHHHHVSQLSQSEFDSVLSHYIASPPTPLRLPALIDIPSPLTPEYVINSAALTLQALPPRMAARIRALDSLPYIVGVNPWISRLYDIYRNSFWSLIREKRVTTLEENEDFVKRLQGLVESHSNDIPIMAKGFQECTRYMTIEKINEFLDGAIRSRIGTRLIGEQHVALSRSLQQEQSSVLGVVHQECSPRDMVKHCSSFVSELCEATLGVSPTLVMDGTVDATFSYIPAHLEYILTELLKNSYRASAEHFLEHKSASFPDPEPIRITISPSPSHLSIRIRDRGGGISPSHMAHIFSYAFTTARSDTTDAEGGGGPYAMQQVGGSAALDIGSASGPGDENVFGDMSGAVLRSGMGTIAGLGYGLPLARLYAQYFGGDMQLATLYGYGTDVFVKLRNLDAGADVEL